MKKTIAIDFDGVIHKYSKGWQDGTAYDKPIKGAIDGIKKLMKSYYVFVFSSRDVKQIQNWFGVHSDIGTCIITNEKFWNNEYLVGITNRKLPAIAYIDDRGIRFTNWKDILNYF